MEARKVLVIFVSFFLFNPSLARAYEPQTTHAGLTNEIGLLYNLRNPEKKLSETDIVWMMHGSIEEDNDMRFLRHFYDPIHKTGLTFLSDQNNGKPWPSAKEWAQSPALQEPNETWQYGLSRYALGDRPAAMKALGHILHLIEDMTVPDHTRDDPHPPHIDGSPYEHYTGQFGSEMSGVGIAKELSQNKSSPFLKSLDEYFEDVAKFSNENFFSKDTVLNSRYLLPKIDYIETLKTSSGPVDYAYRVFTSSIYGKKRIRLAKVEQILDKRSFVLSKKFTLLDQNNLIMPDYWYFLSRKAVDSGAGVVELFFEEAEKLRVQQSRSQIAKAESQKFSKFLLDVHLIDSRTEPIVVRSEIQEREEYQALPFSSVAGVGFSNPLFGDKHIHGNDTELGVPSIAPRVAIAQGPSDGQVESPHEDEVVGDNTNESTFLSEDGSDSLPEIAVSPVPFVPTDITTTTLLLPADVLSTRTVTIEHSPYLVPNDLIIPAGVTITFDPGVVVKIAYRTSISVAGELVAQGTAALPIVFTSVYDDDHGGNSNGDGVCSNGISSEGATCPTPSDWYRFQFNEGSRGDFNHAFIRYGGNDPFFVPNFLERNMISVRNADLSFKNGTIEFSNTNGIWAEGSHIGVEETLFNENRKSSAVSLYAKGSDVLFRNNVVRSCFYGIELEGSRATVSGNAFAGCHRPVLIKGPFAGSVTGTTGGNNLENGIRLSGELVGQEDTLALLQNPFPYLLRQNVQVSLGKRLLFASGTVVKFETNNLDIFGALHAGEEGSTPVLFTSLYDDSDGNDALNDGGSFPPNPFFIGNVRVHTGGTTTVQNLQLRSGVMLVDAP